MLLYIRFLQCVLAKTKIIWECEAVLKICFASRECFPAYYGGIGSHFYFQMKMLKEQGHSVVFVTYKYDNADLDDLAKHYDGIEVIFADKTQQYFATHENLNNSHLLWVSIHGLITNEGYSFDYIIFPDCGGEGFFTILVNSIYQLYSNSKILIEIEGPMKDVAVRNKNLLDGHYELTKLLEEYCFSHCAYFTSPTNLMLEELTEHIDTAKVEYAIVPNMVNPIFLENNLNDCLKEKNILYIGRLEHRKGPDLLIEAFAEIIPELTDETVNLKFAGRDQYWADYDKTFKEHWGLAISNNNLKIEFLEFLNHTELEKIFASTWVAVFPSRWEPFGNVALEAILAGVPVIVTQKTGLEEIVGTDYQYTFQAGDAHSLKTALFSILEINNEEHRLLSTNVKQRGRELLKSSANVFTAFLEKNRLEKTIIRKEADTGKIFEIFHSVALLGGDNHLRYEMLYKDYKTINDLYQQKSRSFEELEKQMAVLAKENMLLKEYVKVINSVKDLK